MRLSSLAPALLEGLASTLRPPAGERGKQPGEGRKPPDSSGGVAAAAAAAGGGGEARREPLLGAGSFLLAGAARDRGGKTRPSSSLTHPLARAPFFRRQPPFLIVRTLFGAELGKGTPASGQWESRGAFTPLPLLSRPAHASGEQGGGGMRLVRTHAFTHGPTKACRCIARLLTFGYRRPPWRGLKGIGTFLAPG